MTNRNATPDRLQPTVCPHGCRKPGDCLRYDQGGSVPADCLLEQQYDDDYREAWERAWGWKP